MTDIESARAASEALRAIIEVVYKHDRMHWPQINDAMTTLDAAIDDLASALAAARKGEAL